MSDDKNHSVQFKIQVIAGIIAGLAVAAIVALAASVMGGRSTGPGAATEAAPATNGSGHDTAANGNALEPAPAVENVVLPAPAPVQSPPPPNRAQQAAAVIAGFWALPEERCAVARQIVLAGDALSGDTIEIRMDGRPVGPALALRSVSGNTVFADGPAGPVQFSVVGDEMNYNGYILRRCRS